MQKSAKNYQNLIVEPTPMGGFFDDIVCPDMFGVEGNTVACNGEFVAVSLTINLKLSICL